MKNYKSGGKEHPNASFLLAAALIVIFAFSATADASLHSFEKHEKVPVEPNVLFFLDSSGSMLWPMNAGADERNSELCTFGDGTLGWVKDRTLQEYYGRDMDSSNNEADPQNADFYHPKLRWKKGGDVKKDSTDSPMPNDSRAYKAKLVLWRILNNKNLISGMRIAFATYKQTFVGNQNALADWYRKPVHGVYPIIPLNWDLSPQNYNNSWFLASGVWIDENEASKRAMLRSDFRSYIDENGLLKVDLLNSQLLKWIDGKEEYTKYQLDPSRYHLGNPEIRFDGWRPLKESISAADMTKNLTGVDNEGTREGSFADFFMMTDPAVITDWCQGNWVVILTSGGQSYGTEAELINSVKALYDTKRRIKNQDSQDSRPIKTIVLGFVDPASTDSAVVALRNKLNKMADAGDDGDENNNSASAYFATDVPGIMSALEKIMIYIKGQSSTSGAPLSVTSKSQSGEDYFYQAQYFPQNGKQWKGDLVKYTFNGTTFEKSWAASDHVPAWETRRILTAVPGLSSADEANLIAFSSSSSYLNNIASELGLGNETTGLIEWLRGRDVYDENRNSDTSEEHHKLLDFYHSGIVKVGPPDASLPGAVYRDFLTAHRLRPTILYVQSNAGMVHGFNDITTETGIGGAERFAFIPPNVLASGRLRGLKWDDISQRFDTNSTTPRYLLDGPIIAEDVFVDGQYRTFLMGLLGLGGAGLYVLDVTNPDAPSFQWAVENAIFELYDEKLLDQNNAKVLFWNRTSGAAVTKQEIVHKDIKDSDEDVDYREMRFTVSTPFIGYVTLTDSDKWVYVMGNGSSRGIVGTGQNVGEVFIGNMSDGKLVRKLGSAQGTVNAQRFVSPVAVLYEGTRRKIGTFFIGDMGGNIFKGVVKDPDPAKWPELQLVFSLTAGVGVSYPLDAAIIDGKTWLFAGTGDTEGYLGSQSANNYFIAANLSNNANDQNQLTQISPSNFGEISSNSLGWSMLFASGERMSTPPLIYNGYVFFSTFKPDSDPCSPGGTSRVYVLDGATGEGGWDPATEGGVKPKYIELTNVAVSGISVTGGKLSLGVTSFGMGGFPEGFQVLGDNLAIINVPKAVTGGGGFPSGVMRPFYWKSR